MKTENFQDFEIIYGTSAAQNDKISTQLSEPNDFWFHAAGYAGSHLIVRNPDKLSSLPKDVERHAAQLAIHHSKARKARGKIEVHVAWAKDVRKPKGYPPGKVVLKDFWSVKVYAAD